MTLDLHWRRSQPTRGPSWACTVYVDRATMAGETLSLSLSGLSEQFQVILGNTTVAANGAVISLVAGQTEASFVLLQQGAVSANASACNDAQWEQRA